MIKDYWTEEDIEKWVEEDTKKLSAIKTEEDMEDLSANDKKSVNEKDVQDKI